MAVLLCLGILFIVMAWYQNVKENRSTDYDRNRQKNVINK